MAAKAATIPSEGYPVFSLNTAQYDQSTYGGRYLRCLNLIDPLTLLTSKHKLEESVQLLEKFKNGGLPEGTTDKQLWNARKIKEAIIHPDTGKKIFMPFRMSGFVPFGTITVVGMLLPNPTLSTVIFWQWMNQSHNACVNYSNRNASKPTPISRFAISYCAAVTSAVSIAVGLSLVIKRTTIFSPQMKSLIQRLVAYPATASANICNVGLMRNHELLNGIDVKDSQDNVVGTSKIAAKKAILETTLTRVLLPAPILVIPPLIMSALERTKFLTRNPRLHLPVNALVCMLSFALTLPATIAMFPQTSEVEVSSLEPEIQGNTSEKTVFYNKGL